MARSLGDQDLQPCLKQGTVPFLQPPEAEQLRFVVLGVILSL